MSQLDPKATALVIIDLQNGIVGQPTLAPRSGADVISAAKTLAAKFRAVGAPVILVNVAFAADFADAPRQPVDQPIARPPTGFPEGWSDLVDGIAEPGDLRVTKRQWGAFHGTDLDLQLRRRGMKTVVLCGISTNFGVESTARQAWELGYALEIVEDACTGPSDEAHSFAFKVIFPRISKVVVAGDIALV
jgi:nicotinamidase-related amidase